MNHKKMPLGHVYIETDPCWKIDNYAQSDPKPGPGKTTKAIYSTSADEHKWQVHQRIGGRRI